MSKFTQNQKIWIFGILYRDNYQGCGNQKFFGKTHRLTVLEKNFFLENGQTFLGVGTYLNTAHIFNISKSNTFFTTPTEISVAENSKIGHHGCFKNFLIFHLIYTCWGLGWSPESEKAFESARGQNFEFSGNWNKCVHLFLCKTKSAYLSIIALSSKNAIFYDVQLSISVLRWGSL